MELDEQLEKYIEFEQDLLVYDTTKRETKLASDYKKIEATVAQLKDALAKEQSQREVDMEEHKEHMNELWKMYMKITKPRKDPAWGFSRTLK